MSRTLELTVDLMGRASVTPADEGCQNVMMSRLAALGFEAIGSTPDYFATYIASEMEKYGKIIRDANIKAE